MKNRRGLIIGMWFGFMACFAATPALADDVPAPGNAKLKIETKTLTQKEADDLVASGAKVTLGVYLVLDANWKAQLEAGSVNSVRGQMSFGFFNDNSYTPGNFLQNPTDYIEICADPQTMTPPRATCCTDPLKGDEVNWYLLNVRWQNPGAEDGNGGAVIGWPDFAYGNLFDQSRSLLPSAPLRPVYKYWRIDDNGNYEFKLFDIQFLLKKADRDYPVAILDNGVTIQGAVGASELKILQGDYDYWPADAYGSDGNPVTEDWTGLVDYGHFEFVPGGLFITRAPEVEKNEPRKKNHLADSQQRITVTSCYVPIVTSIHYRKAPKKLKIQFII